MRPGQLFEETPVLQDLPFHDPDFLLRQAVEFVHQRVDLLVEDRNPLFGQVITVLYRKRSEHGHLIKSVCRTQSTLTSVQTSA